MSFPRRGGAIASVEVLELVDDEDTRELHTTVCGYRIGPLVGRGGMSVVFQVTHPLACETLAMKVITDPRLQSDLAFNAITAHAEAIASLTSPHIVRTMDAGRLPSREPFIVMERLEGDDLGEILAARGPLPIAEAVRHAMQACDGLAEAHAGGIVHGDIKPGNLVIARGDYGEPCLKIVDFAPSVPRACDPDDPLVTCSPGYASPEQLGARDDVDGRADVWALGAVIYELVTGRKAFEASTLPEMLKAIGKTPPPMRSPRGEVPASLERVVRKCLLRDRELRFENVLQLRAALMMIDTELPSFMEDATPTPLAAPPPPFSTRRNNNRVKIVQPSRLPRLLFLGALGPVSAVVSMTLVRLILASNLFGLGSAPEATSPVPPQWPAPVPLTALHGGE